jgi:hypothetical protein
VGRKKPYPVKKKIVEKPPRNSVGFCGGGQGLSWSVEPRKEERTLFSTQLVICSEIDLSCQIAL